MTAGERNSLIEIEQLAQNYGIDAVLVAVREYLNERIPSSDDHRENVGKFTLLGQLDGLRLAVQHFKLAR